VAGRDVGLDRQIELGQPAPLPPLTHQRAERGTLDLGGGGHAPSFAYGGDRGDYLWGNCATYPGGGTLVA
jgi:hypothetical protein